MMSEPSLLRRVKERQFLQMTTLVILTGAIVLFAPTLVKGSLAIVVSALGLVSALLLRLGKVKPGSIWAGNSSLGMLLLSLGLLGFGLDYVLEAFALEVPLASPLGVILLMMILCLPFGLVFEWRGRKAREARTGAEV